MTESIYDIANKCFDSENKDKSFKSNVDGYDVVFKITSRKNNSINISIGIEDNFFTVNNIKEWKFDYSNIDDLSDYIETKKKELTEYLIDLNEKLFEKYEKSLSKKERLFWKNVLKKRRNKLK